MRKILIASSKGGCGKTTLATNLAAHFAQSGKNTALVELDRQGSSFRWCELRPGNVPGVLAIEGGGRKSFAERLPADTDVVIVDSAAGSRPSDLAEALDFVDAVLIPVLPSGIDLAATARFLEELAQAPRIKRGKVPVGLVANRMKPWTNASQQGLAEMKAFPFPVVAELRDTQGYVLASALGKSIFDYHAENTRSHQEDWAPMFRWLKKHA